jgi:hypothetical protein
MRIEPSAELRIPNAAAQTRMVSVAKSQLDRRKSTRLFKGIICDDISEFESHMPSHAVGSLWRVYPVHGLCEQRQRLDLYEGERIQRETARYLNLTDGFGLRKNHL